MALRLVGFGQQTVSVFCPPFFPVLILCPLPAPIPRPQDYPFPYGTVLYFWSRRHSPLLWGQIWGGFGSFFLWSFFFCFSFKLPPWTTVFRTCTRCPTWGWGATACQAAGSTACMRARALSMATVNPSGCTTHPAWNPPGHHLPASTTPAPIPLAHPSLRTSTAAWRSPSGISNTSRSIIPTSKATFHTCSGCRGRTREVPGLVPECF